MIKLKVRKGDKVIVIAGKDKGKEGDILAVFPKRNKVLVSGINVVIKHQKPTQHSDGGRISKEMPIHISNVSHIDPKTMKPTRVGLKIIDGKKVRIAKKSGEIINHGSKS